MNDELELMINRMSDEVISQTKIIPWSAPIPFFGDIFSSSIATVGLNPSNREYVDIAGNELNGANRRFHTTKSLKLRKWDEVTSKDLELILDSCRNYFNRNPYNWFKKLDYIISGLNRSYYFPSQNACHLDLIPYATASKWSELSQKERSLLLDISGDTLGNIIRASSIKILILNGITIIENFKKIAAIEFDKEEIRDWTLPRMSGTGVAGFSYRGSLTNIYGVDLKRTILVLGYNHNIQSSFGVTSQVLDSIRHWISTTNK